MLSFPSFAGVIVIYLLAAFPSDGFPEYERHPNDGWYNNLLHPDWGAIDTHLLRRSATRYSDGVYQPSGPNRPNPFEVSQIAFSGTNSNSSVRARNALLVFFGQQLVEEILDAQRPGCPIEYFNIPVPKDHKYNPSGKDDLEMPFQRIRYDQRTGYSPNNPRQQLNEITPFLDGTLVYGAGKAVEDALREFKDGRLLFTTLHEDDPIKDSFPVPNDIRLPFANPPSPRDHVLRPVKRFRRYGNIRTHENPFLNALGLIWFRYHNFIAGKLKENNSSLDDEQIFNAARKRVIAQYQKIVMYDWLPRWLRIDRSGTFFDIKHDYSYKDGRKHRYRGYDPNVHPGISAEFMAAAMRFGHTLVPAGVVTKQFTAGACTNAEHKVKAKFTNDTSEGDKEVSVKGIRLCNSYWVPEETLEPHRGVDNAVRGMIYTKAAKEDNIIVTDLREDVFGPLDWSRRDLGALNIQRGRDLGLAGYNDVREAFGLKRKEKWTDINNNKYGDILTKLQSLYGNSTAPDDLDLFVGGLLETTDDGPGELFQAILLDQFLRIRHGDRFWYENRDNGLFSGEEIENITATTMAHVIQQVTNVEEFNHLDVFLCRNSSNVPDCDCEEPVFDDDPNLSHHEVCVPLQHYDYFSGSEAPYIITCIIVLLSLPATIGVMVGMSKMRENSLNSRGGERVVSFQGGPHTFYATEWVGRTTYGLLNSRDVRIELDDQRMKLLVASMRGQVVRMIDLRRRKKDEKIKPRASATRSSDKGAKLLMVAVPGEIDLVLHFLAQDDRDDAFGKLQNFFKKHGWEMHEGHVLAENVMWREAMTIDQRKEVLATFFKNALSEMSGEPRSDSAKQDPLVDEALSTHLTRTEFAEALGLQPQSIFVRNMFLLVDKSGDGFVSFDEFKTYFGILSSGTPEDKAAIFFQMFDTSRTGKLTKDNYKKMIMSLLELNEAGDSKNMNIDSMVDAVFKQMGKGEGGYLTLDDFKKIMVDDKAEVWKSAVLNLEVAGETQTLGGKNRATMKNRAKSFVNGYQKLRPQSMVAVNPDVQIHSTAHTAPRSKLENHWQTLCRYVDNRRRQIFWVTLYTLVTIGVFVERAYFYSVEREHAGLRRMAGFGVSVTRGAASAQMFTYASLVVTMSRNTLTFFRETFLHRFIPFDSAHDMHIYVAALAMFFTIMHVIGHLINFYHISTQASLDLNCYFREFFRATHVLASFQYWTWQTITGLTGVALVLVLVVMYVFATPYARRHVFKHFKTTHNLYILVYILMFLHGAARLVQRPFWPYFFLGPMVLFVLDKLVSVSRNKVLLPVHRAALLPSGVTNLVFKRPLTFDYRSGQWVRIACPELGKGEYHPFTLTSSPHEEHLSLHIRAVGPWTNNIRRLFDPNAAGRSTFPRIFLDGPFGESHQDWYRYPVSVLVGGGIGVTPFASILKDIANRSKAVSKLPCTKVYFVWVTRTQQSFEWMTDIIRQVEAVDSEDFVDVQICITQLKEKFDLRTTMLYICERHFQKVAGLSMFTGLRAKTHFGRPKFQDFFGALRMVHSDVGQIGVFSCGPPAMTSSVQTACTEQNAIKGPSFIHHFENF